MSTRFSIVRSMVWPYALPLIGGALLAVALGILEQQIPLRIREVVNIALGQHRQIAWPLLGLLLGLCIVIQLCRIGQRLLVEWASTRLGADLFTMGMQHLLSHPLPWYRAEDNHSGAIQVRLTRSTGAVTDLVKLTLVDILSPLVSMVIATALLCALAPTVGLATICLLPVLIAVTLWQASSQRGIRVSINDAREQLGVRITEALEGIEQVKAFHAVPLETARARGVATWLSGREFTHHVAMGKFDLLKFLCERFGYLVVLLLATQLASQPGNTLGIGGVCMILLLFDHVAEPVRHLHRILDETGERLTLAKGYLALLNPELPTAVPQPAAATDGQAVEFRDVAFAYAPTEPPVFTGAKFSIPAGVTVGIIGRSGSGKSTLGRLLMGMYQPCSGEIVIGGQPVTPVEGGHLSHRIGILTQEVYLFAGTVAENIRYGNPEASEEAMRYATRLAGIDERIMQLSNGYDTLLGQHGAGLSGGERQRLALARVILQDPAVVILDEPSASLDPDNTRRFSQQVLAAFHEKTVFVITHDLTLVPAMDIVLRVENGQIAVTDQRVPTANQRPHLSLLPPLDSTGVCAAYLPATRAQ